MQGRRRPFAVAALLLGAAVLAPLGADSAHAEGPSEEEGGPVTLPLHLHVAEEHGTPAVNQAWVDAQVAMANRIFGASGIRFRVQGQSALPGTHAHLEDRRDRHVLGAWVEPGRVNCFVVASLRDVDDPSRIRRGVHWRSRTHPGAHFVVVSAIAGEATLAHELGHFFGNRRHSDVPNNIMSYTQTGAMPFFDRDQVRVLRRTLRRYLKSGELELTGTGRTEDRRHPP